MCNKDEQDEGQRVQVDEFRAAPWPTLDEARAVSMRDGVLAGPSSGRAQRGGTSRRNWAQASASSLYYLQRASATSRIAL